MTASPYQRLRPLKAGDADARIHALEHYPHLGALMTIPVARIEFSVLAAHYPLLWQEGPAGVEPVVLGGLIPGKGLLTLRSGARRDLPLLLLAYPFAAVYTGGAEKVAMLIDDASAETDSAAEAVFQANGQLSPRAEQCGRALQIYLSERAATLAISAALASEGLLVPWRAGLVFTDDAWRLDGMMCCRRDAEESAGFRRVLDAFGVRAALMVEAHRISLMTLQALADRHSRAASRRAGA